MHIPLATYRLQLHPNFTFKDASGLIPYLHQLGISDVYSSPILQAQPGSTHGYDTVNYQQLNKELGGEEGFNQLTEALARYGMSLCVDIVPNHMAASSHNPLWQSVLKEGKQSPYSEFFDIKWDLSDKSNLSYRRFFDINELVCMKTEQEQVFSHIHELIIHLIKTYKIQALRIDHIDGLRQPLAYLKTLKAKIARDFYIVVEKILGFDENLPLSWPIAGTTGYDWLNQLNQIYVDPQGLKKLKTVYGKITGQSQSMKSIRIQSLSLVIEKLFSKEFDYLHSELIPLFSMFNPQQLRAFLIEFSSRMPVYRLYHQEDSRCYSKKILETILTELPAKQQEIGILFKNLLIGNYPEWFDAAKKTKWEQWRNHWEVFTGPLMAKGFEDTAGYNYSPLLSLNEVGSSPEWFEHSGDLDAFHEFIAVRQAHWPYSLNASSTHDTKRSEDVRARLNVLSELAEEWNLLLKQWHSHNQSKKIKSAPDATDEMTIYQSLLGIWPLQFDNTDLEDRFQQFLIKAMRERKLQSSWYEPNEHYEQACLNFFKQLLNDDVFLESFSSFERKTAFYGMHNSLSQILIKFTTPGIPDLYQGNESWRFDLVDPDNRRPVDYQKLSGLVSNESLSKLLGHWQDGRIKYNLTRQLLALREQYKPLVEGNYKSLMIKGQFSDNVIAFQRAHEDATLIILANRWLSRLINPGEIWNSERLTENNLHGIAQGQYISLLSHDTWDSVDNQLDLGKVLRHLPFEILLKR